MACFPLCSDLRSQLLFFVDYDTVNSHTIQHWRVVTHAYSSHLPIAAAWDQTEVRSCWIYGGQSGTGGISPSISVSPANFHSTNSSIVINQSNRLTLYNSILIASLNNKITRSYGKNCQSDIGTDGQSISKSWCRAPCGAHDQIFITL
jgi:hypothetical protein